MSLPATVFFGRALREGVRQMRTYIIRGALLLGVLAMLASAQAMSTLYAAPGQTLLSLTAFMSLVLIALAAPGYFASVITEEKEAGTLGLLKMAGLSPVSILLGKSTSQVLGAVMLLLVQVPATVLAVTLGGVSLPQVFACYLMMLAFLLFMGNLGLLFSVVCRHSGRAAGMCILSLMAFFLAPPIGKGLLGELMSNQAVPNGGVVDRWVGGFFDLAMEASPFHWMGTVMATGFSGPLVGFQFWSNLALAGGCFLLAWAAFDSFTREQVTAAPPRGLLTRRIGRFSALSAGRTWTNALVWKDFNFLSGGKTALLARLVLTALIPTVIFAISAASGNAMSREEMGGTVITVSLVLLFFELALMSAKVFGEERKWQTLSAIMVLPYTPRQIVWRKALGCGLGLLPYVMWFIVGGIFMGNDLFAKAVVGAVKEVGFWFGMAYVLLFFHLIAYISLILKRGAILLAFAVWFFGGYFAMIPLTLLAFGMNGTALFSILLVATLALILLLQHRIARRLTRAGELG